MRSFRTSGSMSGVWNQWHGEASEAPTNERGRLTDRLHLHHRATPRLHQSQQATLLSSVTINSTPVGAEIYLDQDFVGNTPSSINVPPGKHSIAVKKAGFQDWVRDMSF